jgi:predicted N-formylglutamate amidohydrolase
LLVPQGSDGVAVPGNRNITPLAQAARIAEFHTPCHAAVEDALAPVLQQPKSHADLLPALTSMHSFTPVMDGFKRLWCIGLLWACDERVPFSLMESFRQRGIAVGDNEPYSGRDAHGCTLRRHAEPRSLPKALVEAWQDLIDTSKGVAKWVRVLGRLWFQYWRGWVCCAAAERNAQLDRCNVLPSEAYLGFRTPWGICRRQSSKASSREK